MTVPASDTVVIWRSLLLAGSETFVRGHGAALTRFRPVFVGAVKVPSPLARDSDVIACGRPGWAWLRLTGRSRRLTRVLAELRPAVVHAHFGGDGRLVSAAARRRRIPLVVTLHGRDVTVVGGRERRNLRTAFRRASVLLAVSGFIRDRAIALGADPAKVRVHHLGVPLPAVGAAAKEWDVVFVGRFVPKKGADDLVEALARVPGSPRALFVGDGPLLPAVRARALALGVDATFAGALPPAETHARIAAARVLAAPSRTGPDGDSEGLPTTVVEAAALGVPVVATVHSGIPEAVVHGETGLLGPEGDREALAANLAALLADDGLRERYGKAARARAEERFDLARQTAALEDLYAELR